MKVREELRCKVTYLVPLGCGSGPTWYFAAVTRNLQGWAEWALPLCTAAL